MRFGTGKKQASCATHLVDMQVVACLWALLVSTSIGGLESGEGLLNRGAASEADTSVERKVARRIRKHATRQLVSEETTRNEVPGGTGAMPPATPI